MINRIFLLVHFLIFLNLSLGAQGDPNPSQYQSLSLSLGMGFDDGFTAIAQTPALGLRYEYAFGKNLSVTSHLLSYYRTMPDSYFDRSPNGGHILVDLIAAGTMNPFATEQDLEELSEQGIKALTARRTIKMLSVPIDIGISWYPISSPRHKVGVNLAFSMTYESSNWQRDYFEQVEIVLEDGTLYDQAFLSVNTEFRNWTPGTSLKFIYEYHWLDYAFGFRLGNYNTLFWADANYPIWDTSLFFVLKW